MGGDGGEPGRPRSTPLRGRLRWGPPARGPQGASHHAREARPGGTPAWHAGVGPEPGGPRCSGGGGREPPDWKSMSYPGTPCGRRPGGPAQGSRSGPRGPLAAAPSGGARAKPSPSKSARAGRQAGPRARPSPSKSASAGRQTGPRAKPSPSKSAHAGGYDGPRAEEGATAGTGGDGEQGVSIAAGQGGLAKERRMATTPSSPNPPPCREN